jgi:hypothetical protein
MRRNDGQKCSRKGSEVEQRRGELGERGIDEHFVDLTVVKWSEFFCEFF